MCSFFNIEKKIGEIWKWCLIFDDSEGGTYPLVNAFIVLEDGRESYDPNEIMFYGFLTSRGL